MKRLSRLMLVILLVVFVGAVVILGVVALEARRRKPAISPETE